MRPCGRALAAAYLQTVRVWFGDEAADLGKTMAELDKQLRRIELFAGLREPRARGMPQGEAPEVSIRRNPECPVCGDNPTITEYIDYVQFCQGPSVHA